MILSDYIANFLYENDIDTVFEMIGGMSVRIIDSLYKHGKIRIISNHHEQGAALAACGWAQTKNLPGVTISTSGPGATNLVTGIATSYFDSIPMIFITGQVNQNELSKSKNIRQLGFQETDIVSIVTPITKYAVQLERASDITEILPKAFKLANTGRKGPVLLDIPMNLQKENINLNSNNIAFDSKIEINVDTETVPKYKNIIKQINMELSKSKRPLFLLGGGIVQSRTKKLMRQIINKSNIPAVYSLHGKEIQESNSKLSLGLIGTYGNRWANIALQEADLLIVLGSRLDVRQTGADTNSFRQGKRIIQIEIEKEEINERVITDISASFDLAYFLPVLYENISTLECEEWIEHVNKMRDIFQDDKELIDIRGINPNYFLKTLGTKWGKNIQGFITDVGANQIWAAQSIPINDDQYFYTSGGMGAMGYALPVAIGSALANDNNKAVVVISGDGGIQCNIQELELLHRFNLPIKLIILNNNSLGMVKQLQDEICEARNPGTVLTYAAPNFINISSAYNIPAHKLSEHTEIDFELDWLFKLKCPSVLEVIIDINTNVYPKMKFGHKLNDMFPRSI